MAESQTEGHSAAVERNIGRRIIVQGGVYRDMETDTKDEYKRATKQSAKEGYAVLMNGGTAVDAVEAAINVLESNEHFNAGRGSLLNNEREVECDAMIMEGETLNYGAVISGKYFLHPVSLAKKIMNESPHCVLSGEGAYKFAVKKNFPTYPPEELISLEAKEKLEVSYEEYMKWVKYFYGGGPVQQDENDTVSAVAMDANGIFACATSTGGVAGKWKGRVGDAPLIGCGGYANKEGSATIGGHGEAIMKMTLAREVVYKMKNGRSAQQSADEALDEMKDRVEEGNGGIIAIDKHGNFGVAFNTKLMVWARIDGDTGKMTYGMGIGESEEEPLVPEPLD